MVDNYSTCSSSDVSVDVIASFKRMKALTVDRALVVQAMMDSSLVQVRVTALSECVEG